MENTIIRIMSSLELDEVTASRVYNEFKDDFESDFEDTLIYLNNLLNRVNTFSLESKYDFDESLLYGEDSSFFISYSDNDF